MTYLILAILFSLVMYVLDVDSKQRKVLLQALQPDESWYVRLRVQVITDSLQYQLRLIT